MAIIFFSFIPVVIGLMVLFLRQVDQYERGVMFTMGKFSGIMHPGWRLVVPIFQRKVDNVELKDVALPDDMERTIAKQAEAEREKQNDLSSDKSNTIIFAIPLEILRAFETLGGKKEETVE